MTTVTIVKEFSDMIKSIYGSKLIGIVLYGSNSWAKTQGKDLDLLVVLKDFQDFWEEFHRIESIASVLSLKYDTAISAIPIREEDYNGNGTFPLLINLERENSLKRVKVEEIIDKGWRSLRSAELAFQAGNYDISALMSYYAILYFAEAGLISKGYQISSYKEVVPAFGQHFIKTGIFHEEFYDILHTAFNMGEIASYGVCIKMSKNETERNLRNVRKFAEAIIVYLNRWFSGHAALSQEQK
jgi:uncharacterized protein (UPF0332 family)